MRHLPCPDCGEELRLTNHDGWNEGKGDRRNFRDAYLLTCQRDGQFHYVAFSPTINRPSA